MSRRLILVLVFLGGLGVLAGLLATRDPDRANRDHAAREAEIAKRTQDETTDRESEDASTTSPGESDEAMATDDSESTESPLDADTPYTLVVEVRDHREEPVAARVVVSFFRVAFHELGSRRTDENGRMSCRLPSVGQFAAEAVFEGSRFGKTFEVTDAKPETVLRLDLPGGAGIAGQVHTARGAIQDDVKAADIALGEEALAVDLVPEGETMPENLIPPYAWVDATGRYRIHGVKAGAYYLRVKTKWYAERIVIGEDEQVTHDIRLDGFLVSGRVFDKATGGPLDAYAQVLIHLETPSEVLVAAGLGDYTDRLAPDEAGRYSFANLPPGDYGMLANGQGYGITRHAVTLDKDHPSAVRDFPMEQGSFVNLTITDLEGNPIEAVFAATGGIRWGFTGEKISGLKAGTHDFFAGAPGHEMQRRPDVVFKPGEVTKLEFVLPPAAETRLLFVDEAGEPLEGVRVVLPLGDEDHQRLMAMWYAGRDLPFHWTNEQGFVQVLGRAAGKVRVVARRSGFADFDGAVVLKQGVPEIKVKLKASETTYVWRLRVTRVTPRSQAATHGIEAGDLLLSYGGVELHRLADLVDAIRANEAAAEMVVSRDGLSRTVTVEPGPLGLGVEIVTD